MSLRVKFWGVRGSIPCPSPSHVIYGGNTSCVEITANDQHLILDAGTGMRALGNDMIRRGITRSNMLLSHTHWDHISGFPFFAPLFHADFSMRIYAGHLQGYGGVQHVLSNQMASPLFPVPLSALKARLEFVDYPSGRSLDFGNSVLVRTVSLNHPDGAVGYRVEADNLSICYVTDTEHKPGCPDAAILSLIEGADLVIYDSTYTDDEFPSKIGWGHSTWQEGVRLCQAAGAKNIVIFHHDPDHDDEVMGHIEKQAKSCWQGTLVARDTMELILS